jgi:hypothetical protein
MKEQKLIFSKDKLLIKQFGFKKNGGLEMICHAVMKRKL